MLTPQKLVENHIYYNQNEVVETLFKSSLIKEDDYYQARYDNDILEWWLVSDWLAKRLRQEEEVIVEELNCCWWGRTTSGQAIYIDSVIHNISDAVNGVFV